MKKIIILSAFAIIGAFSVPSFAQQSGTDETLTQYDSTSKTTATIINTGNKIISVRVRNAWDIVTVGVTATKVSGTMGGTVIPVASMDGVNYFPVSRASIAITALRPAYSDTITWTSSASAQVKNYVFSSSAGVDGQVISAFPYKYIGVKYTGTGTMVATLTGVATFRHK